GDDNDSDSDGAAGEQNSPLGKRGRESARGEAREEQETSKKRQTEQQSGEGGGAAAAPLQPLPLGEQVPGVEMVHVKTEVLSPERASCPGAASQEEMGPKPPTMEAVRPSARSNSPAVEDSDSVSNPETDQPGKGPLA
ncbi:unnamed protein product, partial [Laminaria digitata]